MNRLSLAAYAKAHGVSKQAAAKWKTRGHVVMSGAQVDVAASDARLEAAGLGRYAVKGKGRRRAPTARSAHVDAILAHGHTAKVETLRSFIADLTAGETRSAADAERIKQNALALKHALAALKEARSLVDTELAQNILFEEFRAARDTWRNFPSRIAPIMAAELGVDAERVRESLTAHIHQQLVDLSEPDGSAFDDSARDG